MGNRAIEELYLLVNDIGARNASVLITPYDFRDNNNREAPDGAPKWVPKLYQKIKSELDKFPRDKKH